MSKRDRKRAAKRRGRVERQKRAHRMEARANLVYDPATAPDRAAAILHEAFGDSPVEILIAPTIVSRGGIDRARAVADAALRRQPDAMALSLAADVALMDGRPADAEEHVVRALEVADDPDLHLRLAVTRASQGQLAAAIGVLDGQLSENPGLERLLLARGDLLEQLQQVTDTQPADRQVLDRFQDRGVLRELQEAVSQYVAASPERMEAFTAGLDEWIEAGAVTEEELQAWTDLAEADTQARETGRLQLIGEWTWLAPLLEVEDPADDEPGARPLLAAFADDPAFAEDQRRRAREWLGWSLWGMWEIGRPEASPGVHVTEIVTGLELYVEMPPALIAGLPRWSVLVGPMLPVDGVWRAADWFEVATPAEARELVHNLVDELLDQAGSMGVEGVELRSWASDLHDTLGDLWMPGSLEPPAAETVAITQAVVRAVMPELIASLRRMQGMPAEEPSLRWYSLSLADPDGAWRVLGEQPDFGAQDDDLVWFEEPEEVEDEATEDEDAEDEDAEDEEAEDELGWVRATVAMDEDGLVVASESPDDVAELLNRLRALGHPAEIAD
ncbi:MAG TPA: hypothetical protein VGO86_08020, partial [Candidatus Dormibacteraeota bacterium]